MQNFCLIDHGIDIVPLKTALHRQRHLFNQYTFRTAVADSPHKEVSDILLRCNPLDGSTDDKRECVWFDAIHALPQARSLIYGVMARVAGDRLGRCMITALPVGGQIPSHADVGPHPMQYDTVRYWERHHICVQADEGSVFVAGDESVIMRPGELWWFDNSQQHAVYNDGQVERLHLIIDIHCADSAR